MRNRVRRRGSARLLLVLAFAFLLLLLPCAVRNTTASAEGGALMEIKGYDVEMTVQTDRRVEVVERITVTILDPDASMFYRSLPTDGCKYTNIQATCLTENPSFYYDVIDNPDRGGFIDVECIGGVSEGVTHVYQISYTMEQGVESKDGMILDVIGYGWFAPLEMVSVIVHFPTAVTELTVFEGQSKLSTEKYDLSADGKTFTYSTDLLNWEYNDDFGESMAKGITVDFTLPEGTFIGYAESRIFTPHIGKLLLGALFIIACAVLVAIFTKKRELLPIVSVKPPKDMSPLQMGKLLDGVADNEDVTSMMYYFADKGYLKIDFTDEKDPTFIKLVSKLPPEAPIHERTLFEGLFKSKTEDCVEEELFDEPAQASECKVKVSELITEFYEASEKAKAQVLTPKPMYELKSKIFFALGPVLGLLYGFLAAFLMGTNVGGGYFYSTGASFALPLIINLVLAIVTENYRYKWKVGKRLGMWLCQIAVAAVYALLFIAFFAEHIMTGWEKAVLSVGALLPSFITCCALTRTEKYVETLGEILGFKEFIVVTEEDKLRTLLEENPELYYDVLPYAQVLGVSDEWEKKFAKLTVQPPNWYVGDVSLFDYMLLHSCMRRSMAHAMAEAAKQAQAGGHIGGAGGGGSFGGFGGGGFGGGGGGVR